MIQIKLPVRAYKRLIYVAFVSSFLCFLALHLAISYQRVHVPLELTIDGHTGVASGQVFRGLLQKSPLDVSSSAGASLLTTSSIAATSSSNANSTDGKARAQMQSTEAVSGQSLSSSSLTSTSLDKGIDSLDEQQQTDDISQYFELEPHIDNSPSLNEVQQLTELEDKAPNLALNYWQKARKYPKAKASSNKSCRVDFPNLYELEFNNIYWQKFSTANSSFYLYGAYYDDRWRGGPLPMVRILAMIDQVSPPPTLCQIWFDRISVPIISQATYIYSWYKSWGNHKNGKYLKNNNKDCLL